MYYKRRLRRSTLMAQKRRFGLKRRLILVFFQLYFIKKLGIKEVKKGYRSVMVELKYLQAKHKRYHVDFNVLLKLYEQKLFKLIFHMYKT
jgi:hypothetical protein